jgi:hypothetical protein
MALRYRRSIKIADGIRLNLGQSGTSVSLGDRGFHETIGRRGIRTTAGLPGTGLSYTQSRAWHRRRSTHVTSVIAGLGLILLVASLFLH